MGDSKTSLVNTRIAQVDAPEFALRLYRRLVDCQAIEARLRDDVPFSLGLVFPVRDDFAGFDAVIDWRFGRLICGVEIHATGHEWRSESGAPNLVKDGNAASNLFYNYESGFEMTCPTCQHSMNLDDDIEIIKRAVTAWNDEPDGVSMTCPACALWGAHVTAFVEKPPVAAATNIRHLIGDFAEDYAVVFCHI